MSVHRIDVGVPDSLPQPKFDPTLLIAIIGVLGMVIAAVVPKPEIEPPQAFEPVNGRTLADARIEGYRAGVRQAQEQGCVFPVALSHPLGDQP